MSEEKPILSVRNLKTYFDVTKGIFTKKQIVKAVDDVSFDVMENETFGLVGESGCGKTTLGRTIVKIYEPESGSIEFQGKDIAKLHGKELIEVEPEVVLLAQLIRRVLDADHLSVHVVVCELRRYTENYSVVSVKNIVDSIERADASVSEYDVVSR